MNRNRRRWLLHPVFKCFKEAMKDKLRLFLLLLNLQTTQVCSVPYQPEPDRKCNNTTTEYLHETLKLCCKRCPPGHRLDKECSKTGDTECKPCEPGRYIETWNFAQNCFSCPKCKTTKGLQIAQACTTTTKSKCICQSGKYCEIGFNSPYCSDCRSYTKCKPGYGVVNPVMLNSDVKCELCPNGTFFDKLSYMDHCRPSSATVVTTATIITSPAAGSSYLTRTSSQSEGFIGSTVDSNLSHKSRNSDQVAVIARVIGLLGFLIVVILLLCLCKQIWRKDSASLHPKVDANGNCETTDEVDQNYTVESKMTSFTLTSPEQECLLEKGREGSNLSQQSNKSETLAEADDDTSHDCIGSLQPTLAITGLPSALSEPMTLLSNTEPASPQTSMPTQPTSPQIVSPVTNSPHVNVNITLHIGNGSCRNPSLKSTDLSQAECKLPFGQEEESFSTPQQEAGDLLKASFPESVYCNS